MTKEVKNIYFKDLNTYVSGQNDLLVTNFEAINNHINNIITTSPGELNFEPEFGSDIVELLFDPMDETTAWKIQIELFESIERWEPNIEIVRSKTSVVADTINAAYNITLSYYVPALDAVGENRVQLEQII